MSKAWFRVLAAAALCAAMTTGTAMAKDHDRGHANGKAVWTGAHHRDHDRVRDRDWDRDRDRHRRAWERNRPRNAVFGGSPSQRPRGWDRGRKTGWGNCDVPPGQAKKVGCAPVVARHDRRWEARRAERREAWRRAHRRREVILAQQNPRNRSVPHPDVRPDRDHDRR